MIVEICANSYHSALNTQKAGAVRIELCSELTLGGITPSYGLIKNVIDTLSLSVFVLIRPRSGNFIYSDEEFDIMKRDIQFCKNLGSHGIVSGVLNKDNTIDIERTKELIELSKPLDFTFHRAFDCVKNPKEALEQLITLGVKRVLTSGQEVNAENGLKLLKKLKKQANSRIIILPGSGINSNNAKLFKHAGFTEIHTSASKMMVNLNENSMFENVQTESDVSTIETILNIVEN